MDPAEAFKLLQERRITPDQYRELVPQHIPPPPPAAAMDVDSELTTQPKGKQPTLRLNARKNHFTPRSSPHQDVVDLVHEDTAPGTGGASSQSPAARGSGRRERC